MLEWSPDRADGDPVAPALALIPLAGALGGAASRRSFREAFRAWLATDLEPHAHGDQIHAHTWGRQKHDHRGTRWGR